MRVYYVSETGRGYADCDTSTERDLTRALATQGYRVVTHDEYQEQAKRMAAEERRDDAAREREMRREKREARGA
jgi:hypothetical protein